MYSAMIAFSKSGDLKAIEKTLKMLSGFHAMPQSNEWFQRQYRFLFQLQTQLKDGKNV